MCFIYLKFQVIFKLFLRYTTEGLTIFWHLLIFLKVWVSCKKCFVLWPQFPSDQHCHWLQTLQKYPSSQVLQLWFLQVNMRPFSFSLCCYLIYLTYIISIPLTGCFRAGVAQYMKSEWRVVAIFNVILFVVLVRSSSPFLGLYKNQWNPQVHNLVTRSYYSWFQSSESSGLTIDIRRKWKLKWIHTRIGWLKTRVCFWIMIRRDLHFKFFLVFDVISTVLWFLYRCC